jgi:hypothetical protein
MIRGQLGLHSKILSQKKREQTNKKITFEVSYFISNISNYWNILEVKIPYIYLTLEYLIDLHNIRRVGISSHLVIICWMDKWSLPILRNLYFPRVYIYNLPNYTLAKQSANKSSIFSTISCYLRKIQKESFFAQ